MAQYGPELLTKSPGEALFRLARLICADEPGVSIIKDGSERSVIWVPPSDKPFEEHLELRDAKLVGGGPDYAMREAEFFIAGDDEEALRLYSELASDLDDPYVGYFYDRFAGIYNRHDHDLCIDLAQSSAIDSTGTPLVAARSAYTGEVITR